MVDLISRQAVIRILEDNSAYVSAWAFLSFEQILEKIRDLPIAEPDVIHCKECVYYENETHGLCDLGGEWAPDDYCSYGRRPKHG